MATSTRKGMDKLGKRKKNLADQSVEDFMSGFNDADSSESESGEVSPKKMKQQNKQQNRQHNKQQQQRQKISGKETQKTKTGKGVEKGTGVLAQHKSSLEKLKHQDPEFYDFLKDEDASLLNFDVPDSDVTDTSDEEGESDEGSDADVPSDEDDEDIDIPMSSDEDSEENSEENVVIKPSKKGKEKKESKKVDSKKKTPDGSAVGTDKQSKVKSDKQTKVKEQKELKKKQDKAGKKSEIAEKKSKDDDEDEEEFGDFDTDADSDEEMYHKPPEQLEVMEEAGSDDDDADDDDGNEAVKKSKGKKVTQAMIDDWTQRLRNQPSPVLIGTVAQVLKAAVQRTSRESEDTKFEVIGGTIFNAVVKMCLVDIPPALHKLLNLPTTTDLQKPVLPSSEDKRWVKIKGHVKSYLTDILKLMSDISEVSMVNVLLKHVHKMVAFYASNTKVVKIVMKRAISIWSKGEETSRIMAFLIINRLIKINQEFFLEDCIKKLYMAYVRNCKFTSPNTLPLINFMQRSFVEIISLDVEIAYQYAFMYIRQLAIHLRNATSIKKKETCQAVYNWQYIHCLSLWSRVMSMTYPNQVLEPLIYPLVQTIIGTIKLIPTQKYYPLRFHCVQSLTMISKATNIYIPVLPFLLEVFEQTDFNKKHKAINFKPFNFACILRFSKTQLQERAFKDGLIDQLYELLLEFLSAHAHSMSFPELVLPAQLQLKDFLKQCKVGNFTKQIKQIYDKVCENSQFITARRSKTAFSLSDTKAIDLWERQCKEDDTPIGKYYTSWRKLRDRELMHLIAEKDKIVDDKVPEIVRPKLPQKATDEDKKEFAALFDSDSEEEKIDFSESFLPPDEKRQLRIERKKNQQTTDKKDNKQKKKAGSDSEDYSDFDSDELEQLAGSGDDDDSEEDNDDAEGGEDDEESSDDEKGAEDMMDDDDDEDNDDDDDKEDVVEDFTMSSDDDSS